MSDQQQAQDPSSNEDVLETLKALEDKYERLARVEATQRSKGKPDPINSIMGGIGLWFMLNAILSSEKVDPIQDKVNHFMLGALFAKTSPDEIDYVLSELDKTAKKYGIDDAVQLKKSSCETITKMIKMVKAEAEAEQVAP